MDYISVGQARGMGGLRLVLGMGTPGPWSISARALFDIRKVPFVPVGQELMGANEELVAWTGRRNAPVAVYDNEPAVDGWLEIMVLAERLGSGPSLCPDNPIERALAVGFSAEICGRGGFGFRLGLHFLLLLFGLGSLGSGRRSRGGSLGGGSRFSRSRGVLRPDGRGAEAGGQQQCE